MQTTKEVSQRLGVNVQTIRRWSDEYRDYMSESAHNGDKRTYTDDDLLLLWSIRRWRQLGLSLPEISERLTKGERTNDGLPPLATDEPPKAVMVSETVHTAALAEIHRLEADRDRLLAERDSALVDKQVFSERITALEREIGRLQGTLAERQSTRFWLIALAAAVAITVIVTAILLLAGR